MVTDDHGINVMYDSTFTDMKALETELLKTCSFYINKIEPLVENDLRNIFPSVDRFTLIKDVLDLEE